MKMGIFVPDSILKPLVSKMLLCIMVRTGDDRENSPKLESKGYELDFGVNL
jgi:hypothetical protein